MGSGRSDLGIEGRKSGRFQAEGLITANNPIEDAANLWHFTRMRLRELISGLSVMAMTTGCATIAAEEQAAVFRDPARFEGQRVYVCGRLSGTSNIYSSDDEPRGLSIWATEETAPLVLQKLKSQRSVCLKGIIEHIGCETKKEIICTDWAFDYAIKVAEVE